MEYFDPSTLQKAIDYVPLPSVQKHTPSPLDLREVLDRRDGNYEWLGREFLAQASQF